MKIIQSQLTPDQYYQDEHPKKQIYLHHTAGGPNPFTAVHGWQFTVDKVATAYVVAREPDDSKSYQEGDIVQCFDPKQWAYHLGLKTSNNYLLNCGSIGIEISNWGQLILKGDGEFYNYVNRVVPADQVVELAIPYRGFKYYQKYTDSQLEAVRELILSLCGQFNIPKDFHENMFEVNTQALSGEAGIWTHTSVRNDKTDCSPQLNLISMLKSL